MIRFLSLSLCATISCTNLAYAQNIDVTSINKKAIAEVYQHKLPTTQPAFSYQDAQTKIQENRDGAHNQRDINIQSQFGAYSMSKSMDGSIQADDAKNKRVSTIPVLKF